MGGWEGRRERGRWEGERGEGEGEREGESEKETEIKRREGGGRERQRGEEDRKKERERMRVRTDRNGGGERSVTRGVPTKHLPPYGVSGKNVLCWLNHIHSTVPEPYYSTVFRPIPHMGWPHTVCYMRTRY